MRLLCACLLLLDLFSKWALLKIVPFQGISLFQTPWVSFSLDLAFNTGAAWGLFQGHAALLFVLRAAIVAAVIFFLVKERRENFALWLLVTGAVGNIIDYGLYGHVVDFFHFRFFGASFPIFNLADCYLTLSFFFLLFSQRKAARVT